HRVDRKRMCIRDDGKPAVTHFTVLERFSAHTFVRVKLETGRTHQIRVHFAHRRHALVGDPVYGGRLALPAGASDDLVAMLRRYRRQALHATKLEFVHPDSGEALTFEAQPPADFEKLLAVLRENGA
ncbi:MAG: pseudouridine synthase, partial [Gammaproteobacteria bacterium]|nr:pseudouridine synthase [Gammaproteobacteria bacterium]